VKYRAPRIAGLPKGWSRLQQYRFSHLGAQAIAAYLESGAE
jgi:hypothetical protein